MQRIRFVVERLFLGDPQGDRLPCTAVINGKVYQFEFTQQEVSDALHAHGDDERAALQELLTDHMRRKMEALLAGVGTPLSPITKFGQ